MQTKRVALLVTCGLLMAASSPADDEDFSQEDAKSAVSAYIDARIQKDGTFRYLDQQADALLELQLDNIRLVRHIHGYGYFVDVDFHAKGEAAKPYDLDFWLKPAGKKLEVEELAGRVGCQRIRCHQREGRGPGPEGRQDRRGADPRFRRDPQAAAPDRGRQLLRLHRLPRARQQGQVLRHRLLADREGRPARGDPGSYPQGAEERGRGVGAGAPLQLREGEGQGPALTWKMQRSPVSRSFSS